MLIGHINKSRLMKSYPSVIQNILQYLDSIDTSELKLGRHEIPRFDSMQAWFVVLEYQKEPLDHFYPEVHNHYSNLQIVLEGTENMAWAIDTGNHLNMKEYNKQRDRQYYQYEGIKLNYIATEPGYFYLFTPNIVHITNIADTETLPVRKLVVKIHNDLLGIEQ